MAAGALPFLFDRERVGEGAEGGATVGIFCLLDCRVEDPDSEEVEVVVLLGLLSSLGTAAFRFRLVGVVVEGGSAPSLEEVAFGKAAEADAPDERDAWATWRADDLVILCGPAVAVANALGEEGRRTSLSAADVRSAMPRRRYAMRRKARPSKRRH